jgi:hypothetical protein
MGGLPGQGMTAMDESVKLPELTYEALALMFLKAECSMRLGDPAQRHTALALLPVLRAEMASRKRFGSDMLQGARRTEAAAGGAAERFAVPPRYLDS